METKRLGTQKRKRQLQRLSQGERGQEKNREKREPPRTEEEKKTNHKISEV